MTCEYRIKRVYSGNRSATNSAIVPICIGNDVHEGEKLRISLEWAVSKFDHTHVLIVDALQRHTIEVLENVSAAQAYDFSLERGRAWVAKYSTLLSRLNLSQNLIYWNDLIRSKEYPTHYNKILTAYKECDIFREAVTLDIAAFTDRLSRRLPNLNPEKLSESCKNYVLEEIAAQHPVNINTNGLEVYPNVELHAAQVIRSGLVKSIPSNFVATGFVRMSYRRLKSASAIQRSIQPVTL